MTQITMTRVANKRSSYAERTGQGSRAAATMGRAFNDEGPTYFEDEDGNMVREWTAEDIRNWRQFSIVPVLRRRRAVELAELLGEVPVGAIKDAIYKGWLVQDTTARRLFHVTAKAERELGLAKKDAMGRGLKRIDKGDWKDERRFEVLSRELASLMPVRA